MKPYVLIEGNAQSIESFEGKVAAALEQGYSLAGELVTSATSASDVKFYQAMILEIEEEYEDEDEDEDDEDEE